ncbi:MAG: AAA family ATPase [Solirubrobacterales bacterium]|nr:AAA family ATPase [Solirubrobacterales bacterium]
MHLKSITLKGFKSFPDRTRLEFGPGISVIVGPNGSGKSNVTDAVLWALGEQSPLAVRGQSMQDVIFSGARGQQARNSAEVEVVIDNGDGALDSEFSEISVSRRLDRSGEGEYRLNGARCRLVDVLEVMSDTGLGKEMHSVVSQGRVEGVVTSKPRDRRMLVEEAAGLGKHRKRRHRAQLKLARTQDNLDRCLDVEREARTRLKPLKRQAESAELHERLQRQSAEARWDLARDDVRSGREKLAAAQAQVVAARTQRDEIDAELVSVGKRREAAESALARRSEEREQRSGVAFATKSASERVAMRLEQTRATAVFLERSSANASAAIAALEAEIAADVPDEQAVVRVAGLEAELIALDADREAELARDIVGLEARRATAAELLGAREVEVGESLKALQVADLAAETARDALRQSERTAEAARRESARIGSDLAAVNQFLRLHGGAPGGAPALADDLQAQPGYELALAAALGGRLRAAIAANIADGDAILDKAGADGGSAIVTPKPGSTPTTDLGAPPLPGAQPLISRVSGGSEALAVASALLADSWVVESLNDLPDGFRGTAVTVAGRVWFGASRELRQVPAGGEDRVLEQRNHREQLVAQTTSAVSAEQGAIAAVEAASAAVAAADGVRDGANTAHRGAQRSRDDAAEEERRAARAQEQRRVAPDESAMAVRRAELDTALAAERLLAQRSEASRAARDLRLQRERERIDLIAALAPDAALLIEALTTAVEVIGQRAQTLQAQLDQDRATGEQLAVALRTCAQEEAALQGRLRTLADGLTAAEVAAQQSRDQLAEADSDLNGLAATLELPAEATTEPLPQAEREALALRIERQDLETALRELQSLITDTDRRIREAFEETFALAATNFEQVVSELFPGGRGRLRLVREETSQRRVLGGESVDDGGEAQSQAASEDGDEAAAEAEERAIDEEDLLGIEIEMTPAGKSMRRLSLLSGGEKSMTALAFLFAIFLARPCPFYVLDEVEAALDDLNIDRFLTLLRAHADTAQFIVVTHQKRTMEAADTVYGISMADDGVSKVISRKLPAIVAVEPLVGAA